MIMYIFYVLYWMFCLLVIGLSSTYLIAIASNVIRYKT